MMEPEGKWQVFLDEDICFEFVNSLQTIYFHPVNNRFCDCLNPIACIHIRIQFLIYTILPQEIGKNRSSYSGFG
jgi:hypothetical protein